MHALPTDGHDEMPGTTVMMPDVLPIFPLPRTVLLPGEVLPLHIFEPRYRDMVRDALGGHRVIGMVQLEPGHEGEFVGAQGDLDRPFHAGGAVEVADDGGDGAVGVFHCREVHRGDRRY